MIAPERYTSVAQMEQERTRLWPRVWQLAAHRSQIAARGAFIVYELGSATMLVVHDGTGTRAFHNVCLHRGALLVDEHEGRRECFRCPYHHWEYAADGTLVRAPGATPEQYAGDVRLTELPCEVRHGFVWICAGTAPRMSIDEFLAPLDDRLAVHASEPLAAANRTSMAVPCNWKASADVHNEAYHLATLHPGIEAHVDLARISVEPRFPHSRIVVPLRGGGEKEQIFVFPNVQLNFGGGALELYRHRPHATDPSCAWFDEERYQAGTAPTAAPRRQLSFGEGSMGPITDGDLAMLPRLQRGLNSGGAGPLRLGPLEAPIAMMHAGIDEYLA